MASSHFARGFRLLSRAPAAAAALPLAAAVALTATGNTTSCDGASAAASTTSTGSTAPKWRVLSAEGHKLDHHLIHATLKGPQRVERYDVSINDEDKEVVVNSRLGELVCGHIRIVHGGAIAALLDDVCGILFLNAGLGTGFTANLTVNYRKPLPAMTEVAIRARILSVEPSKSNPSTKKVSIAATVYADGDPSTVYTEATALFVVKAVPGGALWHATLKALGQA